MAVLTYCRDCYRTIIIELGTTKSDKVVCDNCYNQNYSPQAILIKNREKKLDILLKETPLEKLFNKVKKWTKIN